MNYSITTDDLRRLVEADSVSLKEFCASQHPGLVAELIAEMTPSEAWAVLIQLDRALRAEIFSHLEEDCQVEVIAVLRRDDVARLLSDMPPDDRADLFMRLPEERREAVLPALAQAEREDIRRLTSYQEGTAGAAMTSDYATLSPELTAAQAVERGYILATDLADYLVKKGESFRTAHDVVARLVSYAVQKNKLLGQLSLAEYKGFSPLFGEDVYSITVESSIAARDVVGGTAPGQVEQALAAAKKTIEQRTESPDKT